MKRNPLGRTGLTVPEFCLGTMTFSTQTPVAEAHAQIDMALAHGVDFLDTAEMYPVNPVRAETVGDSERTVGDWVEKSGRRNDLMIATKHSGEGLKIVRNGAEITSATIPVAIEGSLKRLKTDYIDLYQFHWPNRGSYMFRKNWSYDPSSQKRVRTRQHMADALGALQREVERGTIRHFGLSNESAWGTSMWLRVAEEEGGPRVVTVQNEYSLLCRLYDTDMAEMSANEDVGLLAFSPLGAGFLSGKYQGGVVPEGSRMSLVPEMGGRKSSRVFDAVSAYLGLARKYGFDPVHMALAWSARRPFVASSIFGATRLSQLEHALGAADVTLPGELLAEIDAVHRAYPMPY